MNLLFSNKKPVFQMAASDPDERPKSRKNGNRRPSVPPPAGGPNNEMNRQQIIRTVMLWAIMITGAAMIMWLVRGTGDMDEVEITNTYYQKLLEDGKFANGIFEQYNTNFSR